MKKKILLFVLFAFCLSAVFAGGKRDAASTTEQSAPAISAPVVEEPKKFIASTPWTAAFADLAGLDGVQSLAPADLRHPPEYELTVSDIQKVVDASYIISAGYERMMKTLADSAGNTEVIKIHTDNSVATVEEQAALIASYSKTEAVSKDRVASYRKAVEDGKKRVAELGLQNKKVLIHSMQVYLASDLGLQVGETFGPSPVTAAQIADAREKGYDIIIDNVHNPVASPLMEVCPNAKLVVWRNFPDTVGRGALEKVARENIDTLVK